MVKTLRSLIHEKFPQDLRVKFELLSRRRDLVNKEKQEELLKLLREYNIQGIVPLGPGTNRYAFKIDGFVVKVATDHDGKIDNMKEFKMAKRLYPYVSKTYEISTNGTLLVAEYIQPFESFTEMCRYAEEIREILGKLASVYLIGDVGISPVNYSNWGLRVGTNDPVCLDFAYVYEVSSELFICRQCKTNSMLVPNKDFTKLYCSNPSCGKEVLFESIRGRIGNDEHNHEIGDLTKEGYELSDSNVFTELDESRSNYLAKHKKDKKKKETASEESANEVVNECSSDEYLYNKEEQNMSSLKLKLIAAKMGGTEQPRKLNFNSKSVLVEDEFDKEEESAGEISDETFDDEEEKDDYINDNFHTNVIDNEVAFSATVINNNESDEDADEEEPEDEVKEVKPVEPKIEVKTVKTEVKPQKNNSEPEEFDPAFSTRFKEFFGQNCLVLSQRISEQLHIMNIYDEVKNNIKDKKMYPETFYKSLKEIIFKSLTIFFDLSRSEGVTEEGKTYIKWSLPEETEDIAKINSMVFIDKLSKYGLRQMNQDFDKVIISYRNKHLITDEMIGLYGGIQEEWKDLLRRKISGGKLSIDSVGAGIIVEAISNMIIVSPVTSTEESTNTESEEDVETNVEEETLVETITETEEVESEEPVNEDVEEAVDETDEESEYEEYEEDEYEDNTKKYICIDVMSNPVGNGDIITLASTDIHGPINIPFYTDLNSEVDDSYTKIPQFDNGISNDYYDFLAHLCPDMMFRTNDPEKWLNRCTFNGVLDETPKIVVLDVEDGLYLMGFYCFEGFYMYSPSEDDHIYVPELITDENLMRKINDVICRNISFNSISHLENSIEMAETNCYTEDYMEELYIAKYKEICEEPEDDEDETDDEATEETENVEDFGSAAAEQFILNNLATEESEDINDNNDGFMQVMRRHK